jgi:hypothetical protein
LIVAWERRGRGQCPSYGCPAVPAVPCKEDFFQYRIGEGSEKLEELFPFTLIQHGLPEDGLPPKESILFKIVETAVEGGAEVERLERLKRREKGLKFLSKVLKASLL